MPNIIGIITTCTIEINKELGDILTHSLANNKISAGVTNGANMVVIDVTVTESATSPLDKKGHDIRRSSNRATSNLI